jgi:hypothetical protein
MGGINIGKWLLGGCVAGAATWILEGLASILYLEEMQAAMAEHSLTIEMNATVFFWSIVVSLIVGLTLVYLYALARTHLGPGPRTAVAVAIALWVGGMVVSLIGYHMIGLYPDSMLVKWGLIGLVELVLAGLAGAWIYTES